MNIHRNFILGFVSAAFSLALNNLNATLPRYTFQYHFQATFSRDCLVFIKRIDTNTLIVQDRKSRCELLTISANHYTAQSVAHFSLSYENKDPWIGNIFTYTDKNNTHLLVASTEEQSLFFIINIDQNNAQIERVKKNMPCSLYQTKDGTLFMQNSITKETFNISLACNDQREEQDAGSIQFSSNDQPFEEILMPWLGFSSPKLKSYQDRLDLFSVPEDKQRFCKSTPYSIHETPDGILYCGHDDGHVTVWKKI